MERKSLRGLWFLTESNELAYKIVAKAYGSVYLCRCYWVLEPDTWWKREYELINIDVETRLYNSIRKCKKMAVYNLGVNNGKV
jgi:hypothetical protein